MPARLKAAATVTALGLAPFALTALSAAPAAAHGSMGDPVSRVVQCYAEGPESPESAACEAAVAAGGTQALYDWNGIRIGDAAGRHRELIPDGRLCSANAEQFKGLDLARADWPATSVSDGSYTFKYRVTAPHRGTFTVYLTKAGYDPAKPLAWDDLDLEHPVATATDPAASNGFYTFSGTLPERSGRHVLYAVWQRSDSPEAFYSCSDVDFGGDRAPAKPAPSAPAEPAPSASAPSEEQIEAGARSRPWRTTAMVTTTRTPRPSRSPRGTTPRPTAPRRPPPDRTSPRPAAGHGRRTSRWEARPPWHWARRCCSPRLAGAPRAAVGTAADREDSGT
ncbi:GlcNAc-binding protein A [Streptomyces sp. enrichment culture]